jgi:MFS family permease
MYGFAGLSGSILYTLLPVYLRDLRGLTWETAVLLTMVMPPFCGMLSCVLGGVLSDGISWLFGSRKWGRRIVGCVSLALAGMVVLCIPWAEEVWLLAFLFSAWFFFNDANVGPAWASCADVGERFAGTLSGAMNMIGYIGAAAGMAFAGAFFRRGWDETVFVVFACSYGLAALCWLAVDVTKPLVPKEQPATL